MDFKKREELKGEDIIDMFGCIEELECLGYDLRGKDYETLIKDIEHILEILEKNNGII